jgi:glycosyltransferase involved in cell wall biosynthesis
MKNITIVSLNGDDNSGGVERVVYYLKRILSEHYSVSVIQRRGKTGKLDKIIYPVYFSLKLFFSRKKGLVISNSWQSFLFPADFSIHHGTTAGYIKNAGSASKGSYFVAWMEKISAKTAKKIITVGLAGKKELEEFYAADPRKILILNNFVDEHLFYPVAHLPHDNIRILFSGRLEERKGFSKILSLANVLQNTAGFELFLAVNSDINCDKFSGMKNIRLFKNLNIPKMREFYSEGDILYFPSRYEGFSMATLEALSTGLPVIGSSFAVPEELRKYNFVQVFEGGDEAVLLENIRTLCKTAKDKKEYIHNTIAKDFGYDQYQKKLLAILEDRGSTP